MRHQRSGSTVLFMAACIGLCLGQWAQAQTLPADMQAAITALGVKLTVLSRPALPAATAKSVQVTLTPQVSGLTNTIVNFGVPFPPATLTDDKMIRVLDSNGVEQAVYTQPLVYWWLDKTKGAIRSVQIQFQASFTGTTPKTYTVWWDKARTQNRPTLTPVDQTQDIVTVTPTGGSFSFSFHQPRVMATLPPDWLTASFMVWQQMPQSNSGVAPWFDPYEEAQFPGSLRWIANTTAECHLFDRGATYCKLYARSGKLPHFMAALQATDFYQQHIAANGFFDLSNGDNKYVYTENSFLMYMLTGDTRYRDAVTRAMISWTAYTRIVYNPGNFWTERHHGFGLMAHVHAFEMTGNTTYMDRAKLFMDEAISMQVHPKDNGPTNGAWIHNENDHEDDGVTGSWITSPWMSAFLTDAIWKYFMITNDPRCAGSLAMYDKFTQRYSVANNGQGMWYMASDGRAGRGVSVADIDGGPHNMEGIYHMAMGHYLSGKTDAQYLAYVNSLYPVAILEGANNPGRRFNWEFRESSMAIWFLQNAGGTTPPPPPPPPTDKFTIVTSTAGVQAIEDGFPAGTWVSGLNLVDLDGDEKLDLYVGMHDAASQPRVVAALNDGTGHFTQSTSNNYPHSEMHLPYDLNEDGKLDVSVTYQDGGSIWYLSQSVPGTLNYTATNITRGTNTARMNVLLDINKDGKLDWLRGATPGVIIDTGSALGAFTAGAKTFNTGYNPDAQDTGIFPIDLDNSGTYSLALAWGGYAIPNGKTMLVRNDGQANFTDITAASGLPSDGCIKGIGDYNNDGSADILFLESDRATWNIYLNDGAGHFTKSANAISGTVGSTQYAYGGMAVRTDFDNDGVGDLLVSWKAGLALLRGTGGGSFTVMNSTWQVGTHSNGDDGLCFGDIDADGMLDIIAYNGNISNNPMHFDVYHNDLTKKNWINVRPVGLAGNKGAAGSKIRVYEPGTTKLVSYEQVQLFGKQMAASYYNYLQTERHYGLGTRATVDVEVQFYPSGKKIRHNGVATGKTEVISESETPGPPPPPPPPPVGSNPKFVITTATSGVQTLQDSVPVGGGLTGLHLVDLNSDGILDLYVDAPNNASVAAINNGQAIFTRTGLGTATGELRLAHDANQDGRLDLLFAYLDGGSTWWLRQPTSLTFVANNVIRPANTSRNNVLVDLNKDGKIDWLRGAIPGAAIDLGNGLGGFTQNSQTVSNGSADDTSIFPIDLDNSGNISLILQSGVGAAAGQSHIYRNTGNMTFNDVTAAAGLSVNLAIKGVGDFNIDGFTDVLALENGALTVYLNDGHGHFTKKLNAVSGVTGSFALPSKGLAASVDFDNDGLPDLLLSCPNRLLILRGTGGGNFTAMNAAWAIKDQSVATGGLCFGDVDSDGMLDVLGFNGTTTQPLHFDLYHNELAKKNYLSVRPVGLAGNRAASGAKIRLYVPGGPLLAFEQVALIGKEGSSNYYSYATTERHFGLGVRTKVDVSVEFYPSGKVIAQQNVPANTIITVQETP